MMLAFEVKKIELCQFSTQVPIWRMNYGPYMRNVPEIGYTKALGQLLKPRISMGYSGSWFREV
jgi:hypothetical protein